MSLETEKIDNNEPLVFDPYNSLNKEISINELYGILKKYGVNYTINNYNLFRRAFIHRSYTKKPSETNLKSNITIVPKPDDCMKLSTKSNERLEFLGDAILDMVVTSYLYERFPDQNEGFLSKLRTKIVNGKMLGFLSNKIGFNKNI